jgi:predicted ATP-dependent endonuclease of OLD family
MKICKLYLKGYQQFQDVILDFTHPETGEPLDKICLIGSNGTGKTTVLRLLFDVYEHLNDKDAPVFASKKILSPLIVLLFKAGKRYVHFLVSLYPHKVELVSSDRQLINDEIFAQLDSEEKIIDFITNLTNDATVGDHKDAIRLGYSTTTFLRIFSTYEAVQNKYATVSDVPVASARKANIQINKLPNQALISPATVDDFWQLLVTHIKKRDSDQWEYENREENQHRTKAELKRDFNSTHPVILERLAELWDKILDRAGLFFNYKGAKNPIQLDDNLQAYICLKTTHQRVEYADLSAGIREYIFRAGHILAMYFNRTVDHGVLLVDEPDHGLYPDFVVDLLSIYQDLILDKNRENHTQMIFTTHNPLFAGQFEPYERVILNWNEDGAVSATKGVSPIGDDPNDVLVNDFQSEIINEAGRKKWEEYIELKMKLSQAKDTDEKMRLASEINKIGRLYNYAE